MARHIQLPCDVQLAKLLKRIEVSGMVRRVC
jgi:hypothetical protein